MRAWRVGVLAQTEYNRRVRLSAFIALALAASAACSPYVNRGEVLYRDGRYIEAAEVFELTESKLKASSAEICAEYGLYRGLTYLKLGDLRSAHVWLTYASNVEQHKPGQLTSDERLQLGLAWKEIGQRVRSFGTVPEAPDRVAASDSAGGSHVSAGGTSNGRRSVIEE
jgi:hypothetical protein